MVEAITILEIWTNHSMSSECCASMPQDSLKQPSTSNSLVYSKKNSTSFSMTSWTACLNCRAIRRTSGKQSLFLEQNWSKWRTASNYHMCLNLFPKETPFSFTAYFRQISSAFWISTFEVVLLWFVKLAQVEWSTRFQSHSWVCPNLRIK